MVEPLELQRAFAAFLGEDCFRKFVRQGVRRGRLSYWQEQEWNRFTMAHPEFTLSAEELQGVLRSWDERTPALRLGLQWGLTGLFLGAVMGACAGLWCAMIFNAAYGIGADNYSGPLSQTPQQVAWVYIKGLGLGIAIVGGTLALVCGLMGCVWGIVGLDSGKTGKP